jgi:hypothetical protein
MTRDSTEESIIRAPGIRSGKFVLLITICNKEPPQRHGDTENNIKLIT